MDVAAPGRLSGRALFDQAEGFQELVEIDVPILVEINAANQVINAIIREFNVHVGAEQLPGLLEFLKGDETCRGVLYMLHLLMWRTLAKTQLKAAKRHNTNGHVTSMAGSRKAYTTPILYILKEAPKQKGTADSAQLPTCLPEWSLSMILNMVSKLDLFR